MSDNVMMAQRLIAGFVGLMVGTQVPIRWGDRAAMSSGGAIYLPQPQTGDAAEIALLTRLAVHEAGHKAHTVPGFQERLSNEEAGFFNAMEDPRMEAVLMSTYPGARLILERGLSDMLVRLEQRVESGIIQGDIAVQLALLIQGSMAVAPTASLETAAPRLLQALSGAIDEKHQEAITAAVQKLPRMLTSLAAEQAAKDMVASLRQVEPPQPPQDEVPGGEGDSDQPSQDEEAGDDQKDGGGATDSPSDEEGDESSEQPSAAAGETADGADEETSGAPSSADAGAQNVDREDEDGGSGSSSQNETAADAEATERGPSGNASGSDNGDAGGQSVEGDGFAPSADLGELLRDTHAAKYGEIVSEREQGQTAADVEVQEPPSDQEVQLLRKLLESASPEASLDELVAMAAAVLQGSDAKEVGNPEDQVSTGADYSLGDGSVTTSVLDVRLQGVQSRLVNVLQRELQDKRKRNNRHAQAGGRISPQRHWRLKALGDTKIFRAPRPASGIEAAATILVDKSDSMEHQLAVATEVALAFSLALQRIGRIRTRTAVFPGFGTITETLQAFGESPRVCARRCATLVASGGTPIGAAVAIEVGLLMALGVAKRVLVVVTDDEPGDAKVLEQSLQHARANGVTVIGVSIGCDIRRFVPDSVSIGAIGELPDALARLFREDMVSLLVD